MTASMPSTDPAWFGRRLRTALRGHVGVQKARWPLVVPADEADLRVAVEIAAQAGVPVAVRGAGLDSPGAGRLDAMVLDCRRLDAILEFDRSAGCIEWRAGVWLDGLDARLARRGSGLEFRSSRRGEATLGGLVVREVRLRGCLYRYLASRFESTDELLDIWLVKRFGLLGV